MAKRLEDQGQRLSDKGWIEFQIHFLSTHQYKTTSAQQLRQAGKQEHLDTLRTKLQSF